MKEENILEHIEKNYQVSDLVTVSGVPIWPMIRQSIYDKILYKKIGYDNKLRTRNIWQLIKNLFYGIKHLSTLKKFEFVLFNISEKRVPVNGKRFDIYADAWADRLGQDKSLFIEWATIKHLPKDQVHSSHVLSDLSLKLLAAFCSLSTSDKVKDTSVLDQICADYGIQADVNAMIKGLFAEAKAYRWFFKKIQPKGVFILSGFTRIMTVYAAKQLKIPVYEMQHGFIGSGHPFYTIHTQFKEFYPDYLLSFGSSEKTQNHLNFIFEKESIIPVGSLQIELAKKRPVPSNVEVLKEKYRYVFCVTLQAIQDDEILEWISREAALHGDWCFIIRPKPNFDVFPKKEQSNVMLFPEISTYDILKISDYNISIFSTTIIEGVFLGAKPILFNVDGLPKKYFDFEKEMIALIEPGTLITAQDLEKPGTFDPPYFQEDYFENVNKAPLCF